MHIAQTMILFELVFVVLSAILSLSPHFHLQHVLVILTKLFTTEFWTDEAVVNSNLALAICSFLLLPYLILWLEVPGSAVKDFVATTLTLHFLFSFVINLRLTFAYLLFLVILGLIVGALGGYGAVLREQKRLIEEIQGIEGADRREHRVPV